MYVSIGGPIFLIAVGAILRFATDFDITGVDMDVVGLILMIAGFAILLLSIGFALFNNSGEGDPPSQGGSTRPPPQY